MNTENKWKITYDKCIKELKDFINYEDGDSFTFNFEDVCYGTYTYTYKNPNSLYLYRKPNGICSKDLYFICWRKYINNHTEFYHFESIQSQAPDIVHRYFVRNKQSHFTSFSEAFFYFKHHPTGLNENGNVLKIPYIQNIN
jgi:hypothetical protein